MPDNPDFNRLAQDSLYTAVGFGLLGFQRAQVHRRELIRHLQAQGGQAGALGDRLEEASQEVGQRVLQAGSLLVEAVRGTLQALR